MIASYIMVAALTAIAIGLLVWIEVRSRRNSAAEPEQQSVPVALAAAEPPQAQSRRGRR